MNIETAWSLLEGLGPEYEKLRAIRVVGDSINLRDDAAYRRLSTLRSGFRPSEARSADRYLLEATRNSVQWEVLSRSADPEEARIRSTLNKAAEHLRSQEPDTRLAAVEDLRRREDFSSAPALATRLSVEPNLRVRAAMARTLGYLGGAATIPVLKRATRDEDTGVRKAALEGLEHQLGEDALQLILERVADSESEIRRAARDMLGTHDPDRVLALVLKIPEGRAIDMVRGAIQVLQRWVADPPVQEGLRHLSGWSRPEVSELARRALAGATA